MVLYAVDQGESRDVVPKASVLQLPATVSSHSLAWIGPSDARLEMGSSSRQSLKTKSVRWNARSNSFGVTKVKSVCDPQNDDGNDDCDNGDGVETNPLIRQGAKAFRA